MKKLFRPDVPLAWLLMLACFLCGCASNQTQISSGMLKRLAYGQKMPEVRSELGTTGVRSFLIKQTNTVYECRTIYVKDTRKTYCFLFQDEVFVALNDLAQQRAWGYWPGFNNKASPDFSGMSFFLADFFPPKPLSGFNFTEPPDPKSTHSWWADNGEGMGMMIGLAPFWIPGLPIVASGMAAEQMRESRWIKAFDDLKTGESESQVESQLGKPVRKTGDEQHSVWGYNFMYSSCGFEDGRLVWVLNGFDASE